MKLIYLLPLLLLVLQVGFIANLKAIKSHTIVEQVRRVVGIHSCSGLLCLLSLSWGGGREQQWQGMCALRAAAAIQPYVKSVDVLLLHVQPGDMCAHTHTHGSWVPNPLFACVLFSAFLLSGHRPCVRWAAWSTVVLAQQMTTAVTVRA